MRWRVVSVEGENGKGRCSRLTSRAPVVVYEKMVVNEWTCLRSEERTS